MYKDLWPKMSENIDLSVPISERKHVYSETKKVIDFLNQIVPSDYFFSCGTALGLIRENKLLDWDTDIDIDVLEPTELIIDSIIKNMEALGFGYQRKLIANKRYSQIVFVKAPYHSIDFCFWYKNGSNFINDLPETNIYKRIHPQKLYNKFKILTIKNVAFQVPHDTKSYLEFIYGPDWRMPKKYKNWLKNSHDLTFDMSLNNLINKLLWILTRSIERAKSYFKRKFKKLNFLEIIFK
jgi:lipopolysaccharide cholinephosphotransferase